MLSWYQNLPLHLDPIAFTVGSFSVRWYALSYLVGFAVVYVLLMWRIKKGEFSERIINSQKLEANEAISYKLEADLLDFLLVAFFAALVGGRLGYVIFYNLPYYLAHPLQVISPYDPASGQFVGLYGMSYHGAAIGVLFGSWFFLRARKIDFFRWADFVVPALPLGYFFGRLGNFLNGELYGRVTSSSLGMHFASDPTALRHPSELYEAALEGLVLFAILWWGMRKKKLPAGTLLAAYLIGYGIFRIFAEAFRQPDPQIGFLLGFLTLGQILSAAMIIAGAWMLSFSKKEEK
jgi:phosphatidylglycerol:prolipoprotein diacylglycerol transferase